MLWAYCCSSLTLSNPSLCMISDIFCRSTRFSCSILAYLSAITYSVQIVTSTMSHKAGLEGKTWHHVQGTLRTYLLAFVLSLDFSSNVCIVSAACCRCWALFSVNVDGGDRNYVPHHADTWFWTPSVRLSFQNTFRSTDWNELILFYTSKRQCSVYNPRNGSSCSEFAPKNSAEYLCLYNYWFSEAKSNPVYKYKYR